MARLFPAVPAGLEFGRDGEAEAVWPGRRSLGTPVLAVAVPPCHNYAATATSTSGSITAAAGLRLRQLEARLLAPAQPLV
jgi:hypothetical protein